MESKQEQHVKKPEIDISIREEEDGFKLTFSKRTGALSVKRTEYVARSLDEFFTPAALDALKKIQ